MRGVVLALLMWTAGASGAVAQNWAEGAPDTPRFEQCLPEQMALFEAQLAGPAYGADWRRDAFNAHWVQHCGYLAVGICDVSHNTVVCQRRLQVTWEARSEDLLDLLPAPETVSGQPLSPLYGQVWALAHGRNAGDDCAGWDYRRMIWCRTFEAALKYEEAVWAWQVARLMGVMGPLDWVEFSDLD